MSLIPGTVRAAVLVGLACGALSLPLHGAELQKAAMAGDVDEVARLLDEGAKINGYWFYVSRTALHIAAEQGHVEVVDLLLDRGADIEAIGPHRATPLVLAAINDQVAAARRLIEAGAELEARDDLAAWRPLHWAALHESPEMAALLLDAGAAPDATDVYGRTPLHVAAWAGNLETCELLIAHDCNVGARTRSLESTAAPATSYGSPYQGASRAASTVRMLAQFNQSVEDALNRPWESLYPPFGGFAGKTALEIARSRGNSDVSELLSGNLGATPLQLAARSGDVGRVRSLIDSGADPNVTVRGFLYTPLQHAAANGHLEVAEVLVRAGAEVNATDRSGWTALHHAAAAGSSSLVELLVRHGASVDAAAESGATAVHVAAHSCHPEVLERLILLGAGVDAVTRRGWTPMHEAARSCGARAVETLLEAGAAVDARTNVGLTPLHLAAVAGSAEVIALLIEHGADVNAQDDSGKTVLHYGKQRQGKTRDQRKATLKLLKAKGAR